MKNRVDKIEGIGRVYRGKLEAAGIPTTDALLEQCGTPWGRKSVAERAGIREALLLKWANVADLMRLKGVGEEFSQLLEAAGVDTVKALKTRSAGNLHDKLAELNAAKKLARRTPGLNDVHAWIAAAQSVEPRVFH